MVLHIIPSVTSPHPVYSQVTRISTQREAGKIPFLQSSYVTLAVAICSSHHVSQNKAIYLAFKPKLPFCARIVLWSVTARFYMQRDTASSGKGRNSWNPLIKWGDLRSHSRNVVQNMSQSSSCGREETQLDT